MPNTAWIISQSANKFLVIEKGDDFMTENKVTKGFNELTEEGSRFKKPTYFLVGILILMFLCFFIGIAQSVCRATAETNGWLAFLLIGLASGIVLTIGIQRWRKK